MNKTIFIFSLLLIAANSAFAQLTISADSRTAGFIPERLDRIDNAIKADIADGKIPGAVALVARNSQIVYFKSFGFADIDSKIPMQKDSIFRIGSMSKSITSVAAMVLNEQGLFQLSDPVSKYIPEFSDMSVIDAMDDNGSVSSTVAATKPIKIIDLLTHSAGISYPFVPGKLQKSYADAGLIDGMTAQDITLAAKMKLLGGQPLLFEPGSEWSYGLSTDVLGYLIEIVSGKPLDQFLDEEIFSPLGMNNTYFYLPAEKADRLVTLYADVGEGGLIVSKGDESNIVLDNPRYPIEGARTYFSGGAGLSSTALDYARFIQMLLNDGVFNETRILSRKSIELMRTPRADVDKDGATDFGLGFYVVANLGQIGELGTAGAYLWGGAFNTRFLIDPGENLIAVIMTQVRPARSNISERFNTLVYQALE